MKRWIENRRARRIGEAWGHFFRVKEIYYDLDQARKRHSLDILIKYAKTGSF